ncbi:hypothetical protein PROFUN_09035 [Planoprotostelium fungivorum]|uniref:RING-type E3 ubiquitin transferase n=1 Tax=Planoprotostelium fungivorum TaxID=1890364 RepID=A0A2P6MV16_9EUKA|nr:hypothetical protein PROFUN_09035 [Planoprotostelium fungivorum]
MMDSNGKGNWSGQREESDQQKSFGRGRRPPPGLARPQDPPPGFNPTQASGFPKPSNQNNTSFRFDYYLNGKDDKKSDEKDGKQKTEQAQRQQQQKSRNQRGGKKKNRGDTRDKPQASKEESTTEKKAPEPDEEESCLVCCNVLQDFKYYAIGRCNHRQVCCMCSLRLRLLFGDKDCCICKTSLDYVVITSADSNYEDLILDDNYVLEKQMNLYLPRQEKELQAQIAHLLDFRCIICEKDDDQKSPGVHNGNHVTLLPPVPSQLTHKSIQQLEQHLKSSHNLFFCQVCLIHRKKFTHETNLYSQSSLESHIRTGDMDTDEGSGHPVCQFCYTGRGTDQTPVSMPFFSNDQLYEHLERNHYTCFLCEKDGIRYQYYNQYKNLEKHFDREHFLCRDVKCLEQKFIVFRTALDLQTHEISTHLHERNLSRNEEKKLRQLKVDWNFNEYDPAEDRNHRGKQPEDRNQRGRANQAAAPVNGKEEQEEVDQEELKRNNKNLIEKLKTILGEGGYNQFKGISGELLKDALTPQQYFDRFMSFFSGRTDYPKQQIFDLFDQVVSLLPDSGKKKQLFLIKQKVAQLERVYPQLGEGPKKQMKTSKKEIDFSKIAKTSTPNAPSRRVQPQPTIVYNTQATHDREDRHKDREDRHKPATHDTNQTVPRKIGTVSQDEANMLRAMRESAGWRGGHSMVSPSMAPTDFPSLPTQKKNKGKPKVEQKAEAFEPYGDEWGAAYQLQQQQQQQNKKGQKTIMRWG